MAEAGSAGRLRLKIGLHLQHRLRKRLHQPRETPERSGHHGAEIIQGDQDRLIGVPLTGGSRDRGCTPRVPIGQGHHGAVRTGPRIRRLRLLQHLKVRGSVNGAIGQHRQQCEGPAGLKIIRIGGEALQCLSTCPLSVEEMAVEHMLGRHGCEQGIQALRPCRQA